MRIVLDTNILLPCVAANSELSWTFRALLRGRFELCVTTDILAEYAEKLESRLGHFASDAILNTILTLPNVLEIEPFYRWNVFHRDPDDNKFVDCAVASNADFIVSHDRGFRVLKARHFPKIEVLSADEFKVKLGV